jgi:hypothetical protein
MSILSWLKDKIINKNPKIKDVMTVNSFDGYYVSDYRVPNDSIIIKTNKDLNIVEGSKMSYSSINVIEVFAENKKIEYTYVFTRPKA